MVQSDIWLRAKDIMLILDVGQTQAYEIIKNMRNEIANTKIPGTNRYYAKPPTGKIRKDYFCQAYMIDVTDCDALLNQASQKQSA